MKARSTIYYGITTLLLLKQVNVLLPNVEVKIVFKDPILSTDNEEQRLSHCDFVHKMILYHDNSDNHAKFSRNRIIICIGFPNNVRQINYLWHFSTLTVEPTRSAAANCGSGNSDQTRSLNRNNNTYQQFISKNPDKCKQLQD